MDSLLRRSLQQISFIIKPRAVTGAVPGSLIRIPYKLAAEMRTYNINLKHLVLLRLIDACFALCGLHDSRMVPVQSDSLFHRGYERIF